MATSVKLSDNNYWAGVMILDTDRSDKKNLDDEIYDFDAGIVAPFTSTIGYMSNGDENPKEAAVKTIKTVPYQKTMTIYGTDTTEASSRLVFANPYGGSLQTDAGGIYLGMNRVNSLFNCSKEFSLCVNNASGYAINTGAMWISINKTHATLT